VDWGGGSAGARGPELIDVCQPWGSGSGRRGWAEGGVDQEAWSGGYWRRGRRRADSGTEVTHAARSATDGGVREGGWRWRRPSGKPYPLVSLGQKGSKEKKNDKKTLALSLQAAWWSIYSRTRRYAGTHGGSSSSSGGAYPRATPPRLRPPRRPAIR
jgi:hypothetical protein